MARLDTRFIRPFIEIATDSEEAYQRKIEQLDRVPQLQRDVEKYADVAWNSRLARSYARASDAAYFLQEYEEARELSHKAKTIFDEWDKANAAFLNELRLVRSRCQLGEVESALDWYDQQFSSADDELELYLDWIDVGYIEALAAADRLRDALKRYEQFHARWTQRPNLDTTPYDEALEMLRDLAGD
jgi:tetratricopeptide (TPR) repeat protein